MPVPIADASTDPSMAGLEAHGGMLRAARNVYAELRDRHVLDKAFSYFDDYGLVVTGHSLGAGTAVVLAFLLRRKFPDLKCYAYCPPGCVLNEAAAKVSHDFVLSLVFGQVGLAHTLKLIKQRERYSIAGLDISPVHRIRPTSQKQNEAGPGSVSSAKVPGKNEHLADSKLFDADRCVFSDSRTRLLLPLRQGLALRSSEGVNRCRGSGRSRVRGGVLLRQLGGADRRRDGVQAEDGQTELRVAEQRRGGRWDREAVVAVAVAPCRGQDGRAGRHLAPGPGRQLLQVKTCILIKLEPIS